MVRQAHLCMGLPHGNSVYDDDVNHERNNAVTNLFIRTGILAVAIAVLFTTAAQAQPLQSLAQVPFAFVAGNTTLPAGSYLVKFDPQTRQVQLSAPGHSASVFMLTKAVRRTGEANGKGLLLFHKYGNTYALRSVWNPGQDKGFELPLTKMERELAKAGSAEATSIVAEAQ
jgi:hypothetical protein